jgi:hypothetical protein
MEKVLAEKKGMISNVEHSVVSTEARHMQNLSEYYQVPGSMGKVQVSE